MDLSVHSLFEFFLHLDEYLDLIIQKFGVWTYVILFLVVFAETGLVITPFLPGDSLLFASGTLAALGSFNVFILYGVLLAAAILGDTANYWIGHFLGRKIIDSPKFPLIKKSHIDKTQAFYDKHGGKTIILARFIPIIRTFAPFVAGVGKMNYAQFISYNIIGGFLWVTIFVFLGYFFGNIPVVRDNFSVAVLGIILVSIVPIIYEFTKHRLSKNKETKTDK